MRLSAFGEKIGTVSGIGRLMEDLGDALAGNRDMLMLGGGNPAHIPAVQARFRENMQAILANPGEFQHVIGDYDTPRGDPRFIDALAGLFNREFGWDVGPEHIALTNGSQTAFFCLFNMLAGDFADGSHKKIMLPLTPEYLGYCDVGLTDDFFTAGRPEIEFRDDHFYKYRVNFDDLDITDDVGAVCVSRPTNPTGNVLTDGEIETLDAMAREAGVPLIIDNAYGTPFPGIIFTDVRPTWNENTILCLSLSKLGLPGLRTGIVVAGKEIIAAVCGANSIMSLAPNSMGAAIACRMVESGEIISVSREIIRPFYRARAERAAGQLAEYLDGIDFRVHTPEGALFLWLWIPGLPVTCVELYERLKARGVLVVPGSHFFPGLAEPWRHADECIRITYSQDEETVTAGLKIIADEVRQALEQ